MLILSLDGTKQYYAHEGSLMEHGSSSDLIKKVENCIATSDSIEPIKHEKDKKKWALKKMQMYYVCASFDYEMNVAAMRIVYNDDYFIIDYLYVVEYMRKEGVGKIMVNFARVLALCDVSKTRLLLCFAIEESCAFWMLQGFALKFNKKVARLNPYKDTFCLVLL